MLANLLRVQTRALSASSQVWLKNSICACRTRTAPFPTIRRGRLHITRAYSTAQEEDASTSTEKREDREESETGAETEEVAEVEEATGEDLGLKEPRTPMPRLRASDEEATDTLFIGNLHGWATEDELALLFERFGEAQIRLLRTTSGQNRGYAHIEFASKKYAQLAMRRHEREPFVIRERQLRLDYAQNRTNPRSRKPSVSRSLYVGNVPYAASIHQIRTLLAQFGEIERAKLDTDENGKSRGYAHVTFKHLEDAQSVLEEQLRRSFSIQGRVLFINYALSPSGEVRPPSITDAVEDDRESQGFRRPVPESTTLWVGGMPADVLEEDIVTMFKPFAEVKAVRLVRHEDKRPRAFAHVDFATKLTTYKIMRRHRKKPLQLWGYRDVLLDYAPPIVQQAPPHFTLYAPAVHGDEMDLKVLFGRHASHIRKIMFHNRPNLDPSVKSAFIEFYSIASATAAKDDLNGKIVSPNTRLILAYAKKSPLQMNVERRGVLPENFGLKEDGEREDWQREPDEDEDHSEGTHVEEHNEAQHSVGEEGPAVVA